CRSCTKFISPVSFQQPQSFSCVNSDACLLRFSVQPSLPGPAPGCVHLVDAGGRVPPASRDILVLGDFSRPISWSVGVFLQRQDRRFPRPELAGLAAAVVTRRAELPRRTDPDTGQSRGSGGTADRIRGL